MGRGCKKTSRSALNEEIKALIAEKLNECGIELYALEYRREPPGQVLRIYIETPQGVDTDTCVLATKAVKEFIDTLPALDYDFLEVSSPGLDRILKQDRDLERFKGSRVLVKTSKPVEGRKKFIGILAQTDPGTLYLEIEGQPVRLNRESITMVRLHPDI
jgi:ribosome maturation factor RimP